MEIVIARQHLVQVCWDGVTLTVVNTAGSVWHFNEHPDYATKDPDSPKERIDRFVSAFVIGGEA